MRLKQITSFFILIGIFIIFTNSTKAQIFPSETYTSITHHTINFLEQAKIGKQNPPIIIRKIGNEKASVTKNEDVAIPSGVNLVKQNISAPLPSRSKDIAQSPPPIINFEGLDDASTSIPPDVHGAVGLNHIMVTLNTEVRILDKAGNIIETEDLEDFWSSVNGGSGAFDPKVYYDAVENRWITVACDDSNSANSGILIGASQTSDPAGNWNLYKIDADGSNVQWFDYPGVGINKDWIVITGNMFAIGAGGSNVKIFVVKKSDLLSGISSLPVNTFTNVSSSTRTMMPAITYDNTTDRIYMLQNWNGSSGTVRLSKIQGTTTPTFSEVGFIQVSDSWASSTIATNFAPQAGSGENINNGNARILDAIYRGETGTFWACQNAYLPASNPTRTVAQWWEIDPDDNNDGTDGDITVKQFGRVDGVADNKFYAYPSIAVNSVGDMVIGYSSFSSTQFASAEYSVHLNGNNAGVTEPSYKYKDGIGAYVKKFTGTRNRWGDYTATCIDPSNDLNIWTLQERAVAPIGTGNNPGRWSVEWAQVPFDGSTFLTIPSVTNTSLCTGQTFDVNFGKAGTFAPANVFTVELSDENGDFVSPTVIGTGSSSPISVTLPTSLISSNTYKVRVLASDPILMSPETNTNLKVAVPPTIPASNINVDNIPLQMSISWDNGDGESRLVLVKEGDSFNSNDFPIDGMSYSANNIYGLGSMIGDAFVVYKGSANNVNVMNLVEDRDYCIAIVESSCESPRYLTTNIDCFANTVTNLEATLRRNFKAYPNPSDSEVKIDLSGIHQDIEISLIDIQGRILEQKTLSQSKIIIYNVSKYNKGLYFIKAQVEDAEFTKKLIIK